MPAIIAYAVLVVSSFLLHFMWERVHIALYTGYESLEGIVPVYLYATLGDVGYTLFAALVIAILKRDVGWMKTVRGVDYAALAGIGLAIAIFVEKKAQLLGRWEYTETMPLIYGFGLSPMVQMTVLLPLSVFISVVVVQHLNR